MSEENQVATPPTITIADDKYLIDDLSDRGKLLVSDLYRTSMEYNELFRSYNQTVTLTNTYASGLKGEVEKANLPEKTEESESSITIEDKSYDAIYSSHNIEHLYAHEVELALNEMSRVLKDDGFLIITCPDLKSVAAQVAEGRLVETLYESGKGPISALDILYGLRSDIRDGNYHMAHKVGFTAQVLYSSLLTFGFKRAVIAEHPATYVLWGIATKNENDIPDDLVIELKKHTNLIV